MTEGLHRFYGGNDLHFVTFSCYRRRPLFRNEAHCDLFLKIIDRVRRRYSVRGVGVCRHAGTRSFIGERTAAGDVIDCDGFFMRSLHYLNGGTLLHFQLNRNRPTPVSGSGHLQSTQTENRGCFCYPVASAHEASHPEAPVTRAG